MRKVFFILVFLLTSCSALAPKRLSARPQSSATSYKLKDRTGEYLLKRYVKAVGNKVANKNEVFAEAEGSEPLEKTVVVSELGSVRAKVGSRPALRPNASEHVIWFDKKRYFTSMKVDTKSKSLNARMESPEKDWTGNKSFPFPKGAAFCFFSQVPECVKAHGYLEARDAPREIQIIWDSYPYHAELYNGISSGPFTKGIWAYDKKMDGNFRFGLLVEGQLILYDFDKSFMLRNVYWVAQGYSLTVKEE